MRSRLLTRWRSTSSRGGCRGQPAVISSARSSETSVGTSQTPFSAISRRVSSEIWYACSIEVTPASTASRTDSSEVAWAATGMRWRLASATMAAISSGDRRVRWGVASA